MRYEVKSKMKNMNASRRLLTVLLISLVMICCTAHGAVYQNELVQVVKSEGCGQGCAGEVETEILELKPEARIIIPEGGEFLEGSNITFAAISAWEEYGECDYDHQYQWTSDIDGLFGEATGVSTDALSVGRHQILFKTIDGCGNVLKDNTSVIIKPVPIEVSITSPPRERVYSPRESITLDCAILHGKPPYSYLWIINDQTVSEEKKKTLFLTQETYDIIVRVTDSRGQKANSSMTLIVSENEEYRTSQISVTIDSPKDGEIFYEDETIVFSGDASGGTGPYGFEWVSESGEVFGKLKNFSLGDYVKYSNRGADEPDNVTLRVTDSTGKTGRNSVLIQIKNLCKVDGICYSMENYFNCPKDCPSGSQDRVCDQIQDNKCDPDCPERTDPDCVCNFDGFCDMDIENVYNCAIDCPSGSQDGVCDQIQDNKCDPDCPENMDPDCSSTNWKDYIILLILVVIIIYGYQKLRRTLR